MMSVNQFGYQDIKIAISGYCARIQYNQSQNDFDDTRSYTFFEENLVPLVLNL